MATIGSITVAFEANLRGLETGIEDVVDLFDDLSDAVDDISEKLDGASEKTLKIKTSVDSSGTKKAAKEVEDLKDEIEDNSPKLKLGIDKESLSSFAKIASSTAIEQAKDGFVELGKAAGSAAKAAGAAATSIGNVLDGTATTVDGVVKAVGRSQGALGGFEAAVAAGGLGLGVFVKKLGGLSTIAAAASGSVDATARVAGAAGAAFAAVTASIAAYSAIMGIAKLAASGLSEESQKYIAAWAEGTARTAAASAGLYAAAKAFAVVTSSVASGKTVVESFAALFAATGSAVSRATSQMTSSLSALGTVLGLAQVASGKFAASLSQIGGQAESTRNMAERFGSTVEQIQVLGFAAESAGVGMGQLAKAQQAFYTNVSKVKLGQLNTETVKEAKISFDKLGISIEDLRNKSPQQVFALVAERLDGVADAADRSAIAFDLFGKQGGNILPALRGLKEAEQDAARLGTVLSQTDFKMFEGVDQSFDRLKNASSNLAATMLVSFAPLQTGWNNLMAELKGGLVAAFGPVRSLMAAVTVPFQVFMEVLGRVANIMLRMIGVVAKFFVALSNAPSIAAAFTAFGDVIKGLLSYLERAVSYAEMVADAFSAELTPAIDKSASMMEKLVFAVTVFGTTVASAGVASAIMTTFGVSSSGALLKLAAGMKAVNFAAWGGAILKALKLMTVGVAQTAAAYISSFTVMAVTTISGFVTPVLAGLATYITGVSGAAAATQVASVAMAASWIIATAGLAAIVIAIVAVYQNFDKLKAYFSDFSNNVSKLFTFEGLADAAKAVAGAIWGAFQSIAKRILGFFGGIIANIVQRVNGIPIVEKIDAAKASASDLISNRRQNQEAKVRTSAAASRSASNASLGMITPTVAAMPQEDTAAMIDSVQSLRGQMTSLTVDAAAFGSAGKTAALAAQEQFTKLQQQLADDKIVPEVDGEKGLTALEIFEKRAAKIQENLKNNIKLADVLSPEQVLDFAKATSDAANEAQLAVDKIARGTDLGSTFAESKFFPTSDEIKAQAQKFQEEYAANEKAIAKKLADGEFGSNAEEAMRAANKARADNKNTLDRNMAKIDVDVSFASEIRKALEDAFLTPTDMLEKRLKDIANNKSLNPEEKAAATKMEAKKFAESQFGKTSAEQIAEKRQSLDKAVSLGAFADQPGRAEAEGRKLDAERRSAAGIGNTAAQDLQLGIDKVNDAFGTTGMTMEEIQKKLSPQEFEEYKKAIKENSDAVKASLGVEKTGAQQFAETRDKLNKAVRDGVVTQEEANKAIKKAKDELLASLGISKSPTQEFEDAVERIRENAAELSPDEIAKGLKEAKDRLLSALGIDKSPAQANIEIMGKLREAFEKGAISAEEFAKGSQKAKDALLQSLGIPLDPVTQLATRMADLQEAFDAGLISSEEFAKGQEEAKRSMLPGGEAKSPVKQFQEDIDAVNRAVEQGLISGEDGAQRKKVLQAQLQEDLKPALDNVAQDRRQIDTADVRSKAGVDTFFRILRGNDNPSLKAQLEIARNTRLLAEAQQDPDAAPVIAQLSAK